MEETTFEMLNLSKSTLNAISKKNFKIASEIQAKIIPIIFEQKNDVIGIAQTGTGKTGAFGLPLIDMIKPNNKLPQAIILTPTRELALQVSSELNMFMGEKRLNILTVYGGAPINTQIKTLRRGIDIAVGTPGRVLDLLKRGELNLSQSRYFILDEADEMLKMGFIEDIELIFEKSSKKKRVYLFSATMPERIKELSKKYMSKQQIIEIKKQETISNLIEQSFYKIKQSEKFEVLSKIIDIEEFFYGIIFCKTKIEVDNITSMLRKSGHDVDCIHGDIIQNKREKILKKFKDQRINILVATDVAARGIDVENLSHVINYNLPQDAETYTHRIGRTGRAGNKGKAISLVTPTQIRYISQIEKTLKIKIGCAKIPSSKEVNIIKNNKLMTNMTALLNKPEIDSFESIAKELIESYDPIKIISALLYENNSKKQADETTKYKNFDNQNKTKKDKQGFKKRKFNKNKISYR